MEDYTKLELNDGGWMPRVAFGTGSTYIDREDEATEGIIKALKVGYRWIDTAAVYNTEISVRRALAKLKEDGICKREDVFITSKVLPLYHKFQEVSSCF